MVAKPVALQVTPHPSIQVGTDQQEFLGFFTAAQDGQGLGEILPMPGGIDGQMDLDPLILLAEIPQVFSGFSGHADTS